MSTLLSSFTLTYSIQLPAQQFPIRLNEVAFMVRLEKLVEKLLKSQKKGTDYTLNTFVEIKQEIESNYNTTFNIDQYMDQVSKELNKQGVKTPKKDFDAIKKKLKAKDKKAKKHTRHIADVMYLEGYQMNALDNEMVFMTKTSKHKDKNKDEDKEEIVLPSLLVYGVTITLCGLFLIVFQFLYVRTGVEKW